MKYRVQTTSKSGNTGRTFQSARTALTAYNNIRNLLRRLGYTIADAGKGRNSRAELWIKEGCADCNIEIWPVTDTDTTTPAHDAAQLASEQEQEQKRNFFHIFRNVLRETNDGPALEPTRREWLHLTPAGRYVWSDHDRATDIRFSDSCRIVENLQTHGNAYRFNYGKIWLY